MCVTVSHEYFVMDHEYSPLHVSYSAVHAHGDSNVLVRILPCNSLMMFIRLQVFLHDLGKGFPTWFWKRAFPWKWLSYMVLEIGFSTKQVSYRNEETSFPTKHASLWKRAFLWNRLSYMDIEIGFLVKTSFRTETDFLIWILKRDFLWKPVSYKTGFLIWIWKGAFFLWKWTFLI